MAVGSRLVFDIGGTRLRRAVIDSGDNFVLIDKHDTAGADLKTRLETLITQTLGDHEVNFIGISFAGQVQNGAITSAPNVALGGLAGLDLPGWLRARFNLAGAVDNDLKCAALAESSLRPHSRALAVLYIGTGLGGALVQEGRIIRGSRNLAGEIGHIPFEKAPFACGCGGAACLELSASGSGVARWCQALNLPAKTLTDVLTLAPANPKAAQIAARFERGVAHGVQTLAALFNPDTLVLGGGVVLGNPPVLQMAKRALTGAFKPAQTLHIECSTLGDNANLLGASKLV